MKISLYTPLSINEIGQRDNQEDTIIQWKNCLFVLCDGMGGHEHGEVASQTVCNSLVTWFDLKDNPNSLSDDQLRDALEYAYQQLDKYADDNPRQMGTTLTLLYIHAQGVTAVHMGDSRIYHIRPYSPPESGGVRGGLKSGLLYQSRDHSLVFDLFQSGEITYEEMDNYAQKNVITRAMTPGEDNRMRPDIIHISDIQPGDYFYMCSDGMLEQMSNNELVDLLSSDATDDRKRQQLIAATSMNQDNHSAWLIHVKDVVMEEGDEQLQNEEQTSRCNVLNIMPVVASDSDVQIADENDDVVMVSAPTKTKKKQMPFLKWIIAAILCLGILVAACFVFFDDDDKEDEETDKIERIMQKPIKPSHQEFDGTLIKDSNRINSNDSTRNK
jgi:protein phosphatase